MTHPPPGEGTREMTIHTLPLNFKISAELKTRLTRYADAQGMPLASAARIALDDFLTRNGYPKGDA